MLLVSRHATRRCTEFSLASLPALPCGTSVACLKYNICSEAASSRSEAKRCGMLNGRRRRCEAGSEVCKSV